MSAILIELHAKRDLPVGAIEYFSIESPEGVMFNQPDQVSTIGLNVANTRPFRVEGVQLTVGTSVFFENNLATSKSEICSC